MRTIFLLILLCSFRKSTASHWMQYVTAITPEINSTVGKLDGEQFVCYQSTRVISKAQWLENIHNDVPDYWKNEKNRIWRENEDLQHHLNQIVEHFHDIKGNHTLHRTHRCELDDNGTQKGFIGFSYDGQDFIILNLTTGNWTAANDRAERFLKNWESAITESIHWKHHLNTCIEWLRLLLELKDSHMLQNLTPITPAIDSTSGHLVADVQLLLLCTNATKIPETDAGKGSDGRPDLPLFTIFGVIVLFLVAAAALFCMKWKKKNGDILLKDYLQNVNFNNCPFKTRLSDFTSVPVEPSFED
ncbi:DLA class I histocompatibility antigen, A9/A9 alpha chain-like [Tachysurus fulvidraco]|uniref:DLA class I histocompatibility antigen, A9/A9 alpha chain-like n=1 Tax=Tachysurus fulvidraco TaxID=1234273 RepID=UPI001FEF114B|nr:DLA class I histocompatibility antigen, A9/A9 alpha chain-like [Tachysurus fulvidraco]